MLVRNRLLVVCKWPLCSANTFPGVLSVYEGASEWDRETVRGTRKNCRSAESNGGTLVNWPWVKCSQIAFFESANEPVFETILIVCRIIKWENLHRILVRCNYYGINIAQKNIITTLTRGRECTCPGLLIQWPHITAASTLISRESSLISSLFFGFSPPSNW